MENKGLVEQADKKENIDSFAIDIHFSRRDEGEINLMRRVLAFIIGLAGLLIISLVIGIILFFLPVPKEYIDGITTFGSYGTLFLAFIILFWDHLKKLFKQFLDFEVIVRGLLMGLLVMIIPIAYLNIINLFHEFPVNENESAIRVMAVQFPVLIIIFAGLLGPMCEEFTYRVGLFGSIRKKSKVAAYIVTAIVFGLIHFDFMAFGNVDKLLIELANLPAYIISGLILTYTYDRYGFGAACVAHMFNNVFGLVETIIG